MQHEEYMRRAIQKAREGIALGQTPFGACLVRDGEVIATEHNGVWLEMDITAHAEIRAIREACRRMGSVDLSGCVIYSTTEPCPMCFSAIHWARISKIYYGTTIADAREAGFNELAIANETLKELSSSLIQIESGFLREDCRNLFKEWRTREDRKAY